MRSFDVISLIPAEPGWQAAFLGYDDGQGDAWTAEPLIAWGIYQVTAHEGGRTHVTREVIGVAVLEGPEPVTSVANFWFYLAPGAPEPTTEEIEIAQLSRREARSDGNDRQGAG
jgi:hypothetical protein